MVQSLQKLNGGVISLIALDSVRAQVRLKKSHHRLIFGVIAPLAISLQQLIQVTLKLL